MRLYSCINIVRPCVPPWRTRNMDSPRMRVVEEANRRAIKRVLASDPWLIGVKPAREVVRGLAITASLPVMVLADRATGQRSCHFLMEGFGKTLVLGSLDIDYIDCQPPPIGCGAHAARRRQACGRSDLLGPVAVGVGDYFHHVT